MYRFFISLILSSISHKLVSSETNIQADDVIGVRLLLLDPQTQPTLEYICIKDQATDIFYLSESLIHPIEQISQFQWNDNNSSHNKDFYLSTISSSSISDWLLGKYLENIDTELPLESFLFEESNKIEAFLNKQRVIQLKELFELNIDLADRDQTYPPSTTNIDPKLKARSPKNPSSDQGFGKFAFYLIIGGGICLIYSVLAPSGTSQKGDSKSEKIKLARRKRWLTKIFEKGWIDRPTYHFLLQKIENLPEWLGGIKPTNQSTDGILTDDETSVDFRRRKRGESVVRTKDTSEDKISR